MTPGIYCGDYKSDPSDAPALSQSIAKLLIGQTPLHAWTAHPRLNPNYVREDKEIFDLGTVAHALMLQGLEVAHIITATRWEGRGKNRVDTGEPVEDWRSAEAREERDAARLAKKIPILPNQWERVKAMVESGKRQIASHKEASDAFTKGKPEVTIVWEDDGGVICKGRIDWLHDSMKIIDDYKTVGQSADPERYGRIMDSNGMDIQAAFYRRGIRKLFKIDPQFRFVVQETFTPNALCVIGIGSDFQWSGDSKVQRAIDMWAKCLSTNSWPGWPDRITYPILPTWAESREETRQLEEVS